MAPVLDSAHGPMDWTKPTLTGKQGFTDADVEKFRRLFQSLDKETWYQGSAMRHCTENCW